MPKTLVKINDDNLYDLIVAYTSEDRAQHFLECLSDAGAEFNARLYVEQVNENMAEEPLVPITFTQCYSGEDNFDWDCELGDALRAAYEKVTEANWDDPQPDFQHPELKDPIGVLDIVLFSLGVPHTVTTLGEAALTWLQVGGSEEMAGQACVVVGQRMAYYEYGAKGFRGVDLQADEDTGELDNAHIWPTARWLQNIK